MKKLLFFTLLFLVNMGLFAQGNCLRFTNSLDFLSIPSPIVNGTDDFTLEAWFYSDNCTTGSDIARLFTWWGSGTRFEVGDEQGELILFTYNGSSSRHRTGVNIRDGLWHLVSITRQNNSFKVYVDGIQKLSFTKTLNMNPAINVGFWNGSNIANSQWIGKIDDIRLWNKALSSSEIQCYKNCELSGNEQSLVGYWNFNHGIAGGNNTGLTSLNDLTSNNNDGRLYDFNLTGSTSNWVTSGANVKNCNAPCSLWTTITYSPNGSFGGTRNIPVYSNGLWFLTSYSSWISINNYSSYGNGLLSFHLEANNSSFSRTGYVTVTCGSTSRTITVYQAGTYSSPLPEDPCLECFDATQLRQGEGLTDQTRNKGARMTDSDKKALLSNYPNPFRHQTTIEYTLEEGAEVSLTVFDMNGRQVARPIYDELKDKGTHQVIFNGSDYPNGTYMYTLRTPNQVKTGRMVLLK